MVWFRFFILPTNKYRVKGLLFALRFQRNNKSSIYSKNKNQAQNGGLCHERLLTGERSVLGCYCQRQQKSPYGALVVGSFQPLQRTPQRLLSRVPWNK